MPRPATTIPASSVASAGGQAEPLALAADPVHLLPREQLDAALAVVVVQPLGEVCGEEAGADTGLREHQADLDAVGRESGGDLGSDEPPPITTARSPDDAEPFRCRRSSSVRK
jgi:hypothetical protein